MTVRGREVHLARRPQGLPVADDFRLVETDVGDPAEGEVLVRNVVMSVDPYMRGRMDARPSYVAPYELDAPMEGGAVGRVVRSSVPELREGDYVAHNLGWREFTRAPPRRMRRIDVSAASPAAYLGVLGMPGFTAYVGLLDIAQLREGDIVFVSGAAGAVGGLAGQMAKLRGHTVVGSAGSAEKVRHLLDDLGFDAAFDYHAGPLPELLADAAPDGIDVYFDNVGGEMLEAAIGALRRFGRVALCGAIAQYNDTAPRPGPRNLTRLFMERLTLRGFIVSDHADRHADFLRDVRAWLREGRIEVRETVVDGLERAPDALIGLLTGANTGKMLVRLADDD